MIPRANRLRDSKEFRQISRSGRKFRTPSVVISAIKASHDVDRYGFVVPKRVGNAVQRNLAKRRLRAVCYELIGNPQGLDVVLRAEEPILDLSFDELRAVVVDAVTTLGSKIK
jgi:ribonuclease P protein component